MTALKIKENGEWKTVSYITGSKGKDGSTPNITYQVETLAAGSKATVTKSGTDTSPTIKFGIPRGSNGSTPSVANYIPKTGSRGNISSYTSSNVVSGLTVNQNAPEESQVTGGTITVEPGIASTSWTKLISITNSGVSISLGDSWIWSKGEVPTVSANCILICHWCNDLGIAYVVDGARYLKTYTGTVTVAGVGELRINREGTLYIIPAGSSKEVELAEGDLLFGYYEDSHTGASIDEADGITFSGDPLSRRVATVENGFLVKFTLD